MGSFGTEVVVVEEAAVLLATGDLFLGSVDSLSGALRGEAGCFALVDSTAFCASISFNIGSSAP